MKNKRFSDSLYWLMPAMMFVTAETVMGNLTFLDPLCVGLNLVIYYMLYVGVFTVFRTTKVGWPVLNVVLYVLALVEYFVISFRERPAMIWDVLAVRTAMTVSANYNYTITPTLVLTFLAMAALSVWAWKCPKLRSRGAGYLKGIGLWGISSAIYLIVLFQVIAPKYQLDVPMWDPVVSFEKEGVVLSTVLSFKSVIAPKPDGYSTEEAEQLTEVFYGNAETSAKQAMPTNVICIMNESFSDLRLFNGLVDDHSFETDKPFLEFYDQLSEEPNTQKGNLYVPVFGAMTANSEYEFLTGNSCAFVPQGCIPYQFLTKPGDNSLAKCFGEQGYETIAMHPYPGYNWNRTEAYENLGFDSFYDQEFYDELEQKLSAEGTAFTRPRDYMSDRSDYDAILHLLREKDEEEKLFIFNVTMQNHGGFEVANLEADVHVTELNGEACEGLYPKADQYLTLIDMSDEALEYFLGELEMIEAPTMVVMFGDHQPSVETEFFEKLYGIRWTEVPGALKIQSFKTPYMIWTNYDRDISETGDMSAFMLGSQVLEEAGLAQTGLFAAADLLTEDYDAVHAMGILDKNGVFYDGQEQGMHDRFEDIREFHVLQYYEIFE
ncbi:MAG: LTA synthase family protein [Lachnoclostridium sp.]|nr:LTA synthase family protein [Lachnoclostridium sp.]